MKISFEDFWDKLEYSEEGRALWENTIGNIDEKFELMDILDAFHGLEFTDEEICWWCEIFSVIFTYFPHSQDEEDKMKEALEIENAKCVFGSAFLSDCQMVSMSYRIKSSRNIEESSDIENSNNISYSSQVKRGNFIYNSMRVKNSSQVRGSADVAESIAVYESEDIENSKVILHGYKLRDSLYCFDVSNSDNIFFSEDLDDCSYCMFCCGLKGKKFYFFNQPISEKDFFMVKALIFQRFGHLFDRLYKEQMGFKSTISKWCGFSIPSLPQNTRVMMRNYYFTLPMGLYNYLKTLPNYNENVLYLITNLPGVFNT